ncbi:MAG: hypothetical protein O2887_01060 [Bacteroidetes bacterium]|nr:hypothetical protein [Bacteroidota bacterium]MDA1119078.1 hypothetical protein [Bacteroidota bacterium]
MNDLLLKAIRILMGRGVVAVFSLLFTIYFAYELPKVIFGLIAVHTMSVSFSKVFTDLGLYYCVLRNAPPLLQEGQNQKAVDEFIAPGTLIRTLLAITLTIIYVSVGFIYSGELQSNFKEIDILFILPFVGLHLLVQNELYILSPLFLSLERFGTDSFLDSFGVFLEQVFAVIFYLLYGINFYFVGIVIGKGVNLIIIMILLKKTLVLFAIRPIIFIRGIRLLRSYIAFYVRQFFRLGMKQFDQLMIALILPIEQLANYELARKGSNWLKHVIKAFGLPLTVKFSKSTNAKERRKYANTYFIYTLPIPIILACLSPWIMELLGGEKYAESWYILCILYTSFALYSISNFQFSVIAIYAKNTESLWLDVIAGVIGLISALILIIAFREYGMAWGQLLTYLTLSIAGYRITRKYMNSVDAEVKQSEISSNAN